jgi:hypothetical protein
MEQNTEKKKRGPYAKKAPSRGGARPNAGRPKGSTEQVTISGLLSSIREKANGQNYEEILVEDFLKARSNNDSQLTVKYHNLILNKVMNSLAKIEVIDGQEAINAKQAAFAEALAKLTGMKKD